MAWYNDVLRGFGLVGTGVVSGAAAGGPVGGLLGGIYGTVKAATGGASEGGSTYARNVYQTALPTAAAGLLLYPSSQAAEARLSAGSPAGDPSRLAVQLGYLKQEVADLGSGAASAFGKGAAATGSGAVSLFDTVGSGFGKILTGLSSGVGTLLSGTAPNALAQLYRGATAGPGLVAPSLTSILGGGSSPTSAPSLIPVPVPANNDSGPIQAGVSPMLIFAALGVGVFFLFRKGAFK